MSSSIYCKDLTIFVTVDDEDCHLLSPKNGSLSFNRNTGAYWCENGKMIYVHRVVMGAHHDIDGKQVCFVNRDRRDCRKGNLFVFDPQTESSEDKRKKRKETLLE